MTTVIGSGFSGMLAAYLLVEKGHSVTVVDREPAPGGLIRTLPHPMGDIETAANGFLNSFLLEEIAEKIGVELVTASTTARKYRYLWIDRPSRWPLTVLETLGLAFRFVVGKLRGTLVPRPLETLLHWGERCLGNAATQKLLTPGVLGIYATPPAQLSASLILGRFFDPKRARAPKPSLAGTVAPAQGMGEWFRAMRDFLESRGVRFITQEMPPLDSEPREELTVICTGAHDAARLLEQASPALSARLASITMLPIVSVTAFTRDDADALHGFGCLFHPDSGFSSLGALFSSDIFPHRFGEGVRAETWILGGSVRPELAALSDSDLVEHIRADRQKIRATAQVKTQLSTTNCAITRWPRAFPLYGIELERTLAELPQPPHNIILLGNYLGSLGLSQIAHKIHAKIGEVTA